MKYKNKPVIIEAVQFNGSTSHKSEIIKWVNGGSVPENRELAKKNLIKFDLYIDSEMQAVYATDYVVFDGEFKVVPRSIFEKAYQPIISKLIKGEQ